MPRSVLIIVTSHDRLGDTGKETGLWAEELAVPYYALRDAGVQVDLASPAGGALPIDPGSVKPLGQNPPAVERLLGDGEVQQRIAQLPRVADVDTTRYDAIFFPGGHGTMWDLPADPAVTRAVEVAVADDRVVAAVCHGPAGLVSARRTDGQSIVAGKRVNAFTDAEEKAVGLAEVVPFMLEARLRELGARFEGGAPWQPYAVRDGNLITGQNPQSSEKVAELVLEALGVRKREAAEA